MEIICGIDFGAKLAGTTSIAYLIENKVIISISEKKKDADKFLIESINDCKPSIVFIDAPLSLPIVYSTGAENDYFYRQCDKELSAMSPMFLGGLTARAMKLKFLLEDKNIVIKESYPAQLVKELSLESSYLKKTNNYDNFLSAISNQYLKFEIELNDQQTNNLNWHKIDSLLALLSAIRFKNNLSKSYGTIAEGIITI